MTENLLEFEEIEIPDNIPISSVYRHIQKVQEAYWELEQKFEEATNLLREVVEVAEDPEELEEVVSKAKDLLDDNPLDNFDF